MENDHTKHIWLMVLACGGAFLLILILPLMGLSKNYSTGAAVVVMIGIHLFMMKGHSGHNGHIKKKEDTK